MGIAAAGHVHCSGLLVGKRTVLTAAHCTKAGAGKTFVQVGPDGDRPEERWVVNAVQTHPDWDPFFRKFDLATLTLAGDVTMTVPFDERFLPENPSDPWRSSPSLGRYLGYGHASAKTDDPHVLDSGKVKITAADEQTFTLAPAPPDTLPCFGDSGGPLFEEGPSGRLLGVVIHGDALCKESATAWRLNAQTALWAGLEVDAAVDEARDDSEEGGCSASNVPMQGGPAILLAWIALLLAGLRVLPLALGRQRLG